MSDTSRIVPNDRLLDRIADRFEAACRQGQSASIDAYLAEVPEDWRATLFRELLVVELQLQRDRGEDPSCEEYERQFPFYRSDVAVAFEMADDLDGRQSTRPDLAEYSQVTPGFFVTCQERLPLAEREFRFGRFELLEKLGSGGFGTVWKVQDTVLKRMVALKIPRAGRLCAGASVLLQEARNVARLKHVGVVQVYDVGEVDGIAYIASEYIAGNSLRERLQSGPVPSEQGAEICMRVAEALHHAHEMGIVHRDLKPGNILLDEANVPYVADFGLAASDELEVPAGQLVGTIDYMAPEQAARQSDQVDRRSDIFSLGVILYEMLTGGRPFQAEGSELLEAIQVAVPARPRGLNRSIARDLEAICLRCLEKVPADRYATAADLAEDLRRYLRGEPVSARPLWAGLRLGRWARRHPAIAALSLTSLLLAAAIVAVGIVSHFHTVDALDTAETHLYSYRVIAANRAWQSNDIVRFDRLLEECPLRLRSWEWGYLDGLRHSALIELEDAGEPVAFSPDGRLIASGGGSDWNLKLWDAASGKRLAELAGHRDHLSSLDFSPDGKRLVSAADADRTVILWDVATRQKIGELCGHNGPVHSAQFLPDGNRVVTVSADGFLCIWNAETQKQLCYIGHTTRPIRSLAVSPDGKLLALSTGSVDLAKIRVWDVESQELIWTVPTFGRATGLAFSPDGTRLAAAAGRDLVRVWDVASREMVQAYPIVPSTAPLVAFSPDGKRIATTSWDNSVVLCDTVAGRQVLACRGHKGKVGGIAFSPDGELVAVANNKDRIYVHRTSSEQGSRILRAHEGEVAGLAFVPGTAILVSGGSDGTVRLWDLTQFCELRVLLNQTSAVHSVCCSSDGTMVTAITADGTIRTWDMASGDLIGQFDGDAGLVHALAYHRGGTLLASVDGGSQISLWDPRTGQLQGSFEAECSRLQRLAFSPCGRWLAAGSRDGELHVFNAQTWALEQKFVLGSPVYGIAFGRSGMLAAITADTSTAFWDIETGISLGKSPPTQVRRNANLAFHPDGTRLAVAIGGDAVTFWEPLYRQQLLTLRQTADVAGLVAFSSDGTHIASATNGGSICIWSSPDAGRRDSP